MAFAKMRIPSASNPMPSGGPQGTMGGKAQPAGGRPGTRPMALGEVGYLWILLLIEVFSMGALRRRFRRYHGG